MLLDRWSAESIFAKDLLSTFHLILAMITHFTDQGRIQLDLPKNASVKVIRVRKKGMTLETESFKEKVIRSVRVSQS